MNDFKQILSKLNIDEISALCLSSSFGNVEFSDDSFKILSLDKGDGSGYVVNLSGSGFSSFDVYEYYKKPSKDLLSLHIDVICDDFYSIGITNSSDDLYEYGERPSKEKIINILMSDSPNYSLNPIIKIETLPTYQLIIDKIENTKKHSVIGIEKYDAAIINIRELISLGQENDLFSPKSYTTTASSVYESFFSFINYDYTSYTDALKNEVLKEIKQIFLDGKQIYNIAVDHDFSIDNPHDYNDCDNQIIFHEKYDEFFSYSLTSQNFKFFILQSEDELIVIEYANSISIDHINESNIISVKKFIENGITSGCYSSTNDNSQNYKPTLNWLLKSSINEIRGLNNKTLHVKGDKVFHLGDSLSYLLWNIDTTLLYLCDEFVLEKVNILKNDGDFNLLINNCMHDKLYGIKGFRNHIFMGYGTGFSWHKDGYLHDDSCVFSNLNKSSNLSKEVSFNFYRSLDKDSPILNLPKNLRPEWLEQAVICLHDTIHASQNGVKEITTYRSYTKNKKGNIKTDIAKIKKYFNSLNIKF